MSAQTLEDDDSVLADAAFSDESLNIHKVLLSSIHAAPKSVPAPLAVKGSTLRTT